MYCIIERACLPLSLSQFCRVQPVAIVRVGLARCHRHTYLEVNTFNSLAYTFSYFIVIYRRWCY